MVGLIALNGICFVFMFPRLIVHLVGKHEGLHIA